MKRTFFWKGAQRCVPTLLAILVCGSPSTHAAGTVAAQFLRFAVGPSAGMGEAGGSIIQDATALYWNPAGMAALESADIYASHDSLPMTLRHDFVAMSIPLRLLSIPGVIGYSLQALTQSSIASLDNAGNPAGSYNATDMAHTVGWATAWNDFRLGVGARYIRQSLADVSGSAIAGNVGLQKDFGHYWMTGVSLSNIGPKLKLGTESASLPRTERAGMGLRLFEGDLFLAGDVSHVESQGLRGHVGAQYRIYPASNSTISLFKEGGIFVRGGYTIGNNRDDAYSGASWGLTLALRSFRADFAYQPYGELGNSLQFGLGYKF